MNSVNSLSNPNTSIPAINNTLPDPLSIPAPDTDPLMPPPQVLIADDDRTIRSVLRSSLERNGFRVLTAVNGQEALDLAFRHLPDLILLDVRMPMIDGFEVVQRLRRDPATNRIPVMFLTALARQSADAARGLNLGADDYLHKPFGVDELLARVRRKIKDRQLEERLHQRTQELETLIHIGAQLNEALSVEALVERLTSLVLTHLPAVTVVMSITNNQQTLIYTRNPNQNLEQQTFKIDIIAHIERTGKPILLRDPAAIEAQQIPQCAMFSSIIGVPLLHGGQPLGTLIVAHATAYIYSDNSLRMLRSVGEQAALALRNAQLYEEMEGYAFGLEEMVETRSAALNAAQTQLLRAEKLAAIGTLAAGVAHEINNPLQPILTNLEMMIEDLDAGRTVTRNDIQLSYEHVQRIKGIVRRLLDFARPEQSAMVQVELNPIIEEVCALVARQMEQSRVQVQYYPGQVAPIIGNADQLKQVFLNLMVNARDAMAGGGVVLIQTMQQENEAVVMIRDTGVGIAPEDLPRVFDPFFTTKAEGTGIGLAVSQTIIEGHGGQMTVESALGKGTLFMLRFPILQISL